MWQLVSYSNVFAWYVVTLTFVFLTLKWYCKLIHQFKERKFNAEVVLIRR